MNFPLYYFFWLDSNGRPQKWICMEAKILMEIICSKGLGKSTAVVPNHVKFSFSSSSFFFFTPGIPQKTRHSSKVAGKCQHRRLSSDWILICLTKWTVKMGFCRSGNIGRILVRRNLKKINQFFTWICTDTRLTELYIHKTGQISKDKAARTKLSFMSPSKFQIEP